MIHDETNHPQPGIFHGLQRTPIVLLYGCNCKGIAAMVGRRVSAVDVHVSRRLRAARLARRLSQEKVADALGVSFQQVQKYENGSNRMGTGRLYAIAKLLELPLTYFFEGLEKHPSKPTRDSGMTPITEALSTKEGVRIAVALSKIRDTETRRRIANLLEAIIEDEGKEVRSA